MVSCILQKINKDEIVVPLQLSNSLQVKFMNIVLIFITHNDNIWDCEKIKIVFLSYSMIFMDHKNLLGVNVLSHIFIFSPHCVMSCI